MGVESVAEVGRRGRLRWFRQLERKSGGDWVSACRNVGVVEEKSRNRVRKTRKECVNDDMKVLGLQLEWDVFRFTRRGLISGKSLTLANRGRNGCFNNKG